LLRATERTIQLTGSWTGTKRRDTYLLSGTLQAPRGTYRLIVGWVTREFVVQRGTVQYFGTPDLDAALDIEATHVVHPLPGPGQPAEITVIAHIGGTLRLPRLSLQAEHADYSQAELMAFLITGRPSVELSGGQRAYVLGGGRSLLGAAAARGLERTVV